MGFTIRKATLILCALASFGSMTDAKGAVEVPATYPLVNSENPADFKGFTWRRDVPGKQAESELPKNFRTFGRSSGSAEFTPAQFKAMVSLIREKSGGGPVYDVDLRQESHGYFNEIPVSWYGERDWANLGLSEKKAVAIENQRIKDSLGNLRYIAAVGKNCLPSLGEVIHVNNVMTEQELAEKEGIHYFRIAATDHVWPSAENIDRFIAFYKTLPSNAWVHFHCEAGMGRTTAFMVMYDILKHPGTPLQTILDRQHRIGGYYYGPWDTDREKSWKGPFYKEKYEMMALFYEYANGNQSKTWSEWVTSRKF